MTDSSDASALYQALAATHPHAARLALLSCLPVRVTPAFLRLARLRLLPEGSTGDEADLWLSDLVDTRSSAGFSYRREVREHLRSLLGRALLDQVWQRVHVEHHAWLAPRARLEEELSWRLLRDRSDGWINTQWQAVLHDLDGGTAADGVARWVVRAVPDLPEGTLDHEAGRRAFYGAHLLLGDAQVLGTQPQTFLASADFAFATRRLPRRRIYVGLTDDGLLVSPVRTIGNGHQIDVPATRPLWLQVEDAGDLPPQVLTVAGSEVVHWPLQAQSVTLRLIDGSAYALKPPQAGSASTSRVRPPRVDLQYDVEVYGAKKKIQLPFVTGVIAPLSGKPVEEPAPLAERKFLEIDFDNFDARMKAMQPRVAFLVPNYLSGEGNLAVDLRFSRLDDFSPMAVAARVAPLNALVSDKVARRERGFSEQLNAILHHPDFQQLEGAWRGLHHMVSRSVTGDAMHVIRIFNASKAELREMAGFAGSGSEWDQSPLYKKVYEEEFGQFGGQPYGCLVGDYVFDHSQADVELLRFIAFIAAAAHAPFIAAAAPTLMQMDSWQELANPRDLTRIFSTPEYADWRALRELEDARYIALTLPRFLARLPYGAQSTPVEDFEFEEDTGSVDAANYVWANAAYAMACNVQRAFAQYGWCARIRGVESGGMVDRLLTHAFPSDEGSVELKCPTEIAISDRAEFELSRQGLLPLVHRKNTDFAVFSSANGLMLHADHGDSDATANAALSTQLPYVFTTSRVMHYLKCIVRDKFGSFRDHAEMARWLNNWIANYVDGDPANSSTYTQAAKPLAGGEVVVEEVEGQPGWYSCKAFLRPHYQLEGLTVSLRLTTRLPSAKMA